MLYDDFDEIFIWPAAWMQSQSIAKHWQWDKYEISIINIQFIVTHICYDSIHMVCLYVFVSAVGI